MAKTLEVAKAFHVLYKEEFSENMDEMKMHKLMYFAQRESLMNNGTTLFDEDFLGWRYGPVLQSVRDMYKLCGKNFTFTMGKLCHEDMELVKSVLKRYGEYSSWRLSDLSHDEYSWKASRSGLSADDNGTAKLSLNNMKVDAARERSNRKLCCNE